MEKNKEIGEGNKEYAFLVGMLFLIVITVLAYILMTYKNIDEKRDLNQTQIQEYVNYGYQMAGLQISQKWVEDLSKYGVVVQPFVYQNQTYNMKCEIIK